MTATSGELKDLFRFLWVAVPKIAGGALQILFNLILIRYLTPDQFGMVSLCVVGIVACDAVFGSALDMAVLRLAPLHEQKGERLCSLRIQNAALALKPAGVALLALPVFFAGGSISRILFQRDDGKILLFISLAGLLGLLLLRSLQLHYQISNRFVAFGITDVLQTCIKYGGVSLLIALAITGPGRIVFFYAAGPLVVATVGLISTRQLIGTFFDRTAWRQLGEVLRWYVAAAVLGSISSRMDVFMVSAFSTVAEAGIFAAGLAVAIVPQVIGAYMAVIYSPRIMPLWEEGKLGAIYRRFQRRLMPICVVVCAGLIVGVQFFGNQLLPGSFARAAGVMLILFPASACSLLNFPWTISVLLFLRPKFLLAVEFLSIVLLIPVYAYCAGTWGAVGGAAVTTCYMTLKTVLIQIVAWRVTRESGSVQSQPVSSLVPEGIEI